MSLCSGQSTSFPAHVYNYTYMVHIRWKPHTHSAGIGYGGRIARYAQAMLALQKKIVSPPTTVAVCRAVCPQSPGSDYPYWYSYVSALKLWLRLPSLKIERRHPHWGGTPQITVSGGPRHIHSVLHIG